MALALIGLINCNLGFFWTISIERQREIAMEIPVYLSIILHLDEHEICSLIKLFAFDINISLLIASSAFQVSDGAIMSLLSDHDTARSVAVTGSFSEASRVLLGEANCIHTRCFNHHLS